MKVIEKKTRAKTVRQEKKVTDNHELVQHNNINSEDEKVAAAEKRLSKLDWDRFHELLSKSK